MTRITGDWIDNPATQAVCAMLTDAGHRALFVGGCVRNALLGQPVADIDIATDARPERVLELARTARLRGVPTGIEHGTVTVVSQGIPHEITTFRRDVETDGRRAVVAFTDDVTEDARRRDFTMNALYADPQGILCDPLNGLPDLLARRVRFIEDAEARIREDTLRILRFFRFHAWYGDPLAGPDAEGLAACAALSEGLSNLSKERIGGEMRKLLSAPDPAPAVASMAAAGCLTRVLPGADATGLPVLVHLEQGLELAPDWLRRLAVLGGEDFTDLLRLSRKEARELQRIRHYSSEDMPLSALGYRAGQDTGSNAALVRAALLAQPIKQPDLDSIAHGATQTMPVKPADLAMQGAALGKRLREIEDHWIATDFKATRDELLARFP